MKTRIGRVLLSGQPVGSIEESNGATRFTYSPQWLTREDAVPISLTLPLRSEPYESQGLHPFFENLLPEGWLLDVSSKKLKISKDDPFGLLLATCADCIGAVEIEMVDAELLDVCERAPEGQIIIVRSQQQKDIAKELRPDCTIKVRDADAPPLWRRKAN
jgi:HipA-like protein